jgi:hypothetical protein
VIGSARYFTRRYWAARYWPAKGAATGNATASPAGVEAVFAIGTAIATGEGARIAGGGTSVNYQARWPKTGTARPAGVAARFAIGQADAIGTQAIDAIARPHGVQATFAIGRARGSVSVVATARAARPAATFTADDVALLLLLLQDEDDADEEAA